MKRKVHDRLNILFRTDEIAKDKNLQYVYWGLFLGFLISFNELLAQKVGDLDSISKLNYVCPTYFRSCEMFYFLNYLPNGYSGNIFYALIFTLLGLSAFFAINQKWLYAILLILPTVIWKVIATFLLEDRISVPFEYFHIGFLLVLLFAKNKFHMLRHTFVIMYFCAGLVKIHKAWILGTYFSSLKLGMPIFPDFMIPFITNLVITIELLTPFLLLSKNSMIKNITLILYLFFHIYSVSLVGFRYPIHCTPILCILFISNRKSINVTTWGMRSYLLSILLFNLYPFTLKGDHKISYQGVRLALSMFDSNRQCESIKLLTLASGEVISEVQRSNYSFVRCAPYWDWYRINLLCKSGNYSNISWDFNLSINGEQFFPIVSTQNACALDYNLIKENDWIKTSFKDSDALGFPKKNSYRGPYFDPNNNIIFKHKSIKLSPTQTLIENNIHLFKLFYFLLSLISLLLYFFNHHRYKSQ